MARRLIAFQGSARGASRGATGRWFTGAAVLHDEFCRQANDVRGTATL